MTTYNSPFAGDVIQPSDVSYVSYNISSNLTLVWPVNGNVGDVAARIININASVASLTVTMPPANQVSVGQDALFTNYGTHTYDVLDANGGAIVTVAVGESKYIYITDNSTVAGTWAVVDFGATTSSANASALAGSGLLAISNTLNQSHPTSGVSNGYTFVTSDRALTKVWVGGTGSATLGGSGTLGDNFFFLFKNAGTGTFTINCAGGDLIDGQSSKNFQPNESAIIVCSGAAFYTVGYGISNTFFFTALTKSVTSGNYTLTSTEASATIDEYIGTLTGNVTIIYPPIVSFYVITNQTTAGGYSLSVTTGLPGANTVIIPDGQTASVICNGTNFFNANTVQAGATTVQLTDGSVTNPSLSFATESNTGIYRPSVGEFGITVLGNQIVDVTATGIDVTGSGTFSGGISGGTF